MQYQFLSDLSKRDHLHYLGNNKNKKLLLYFHGWSGNLPMLSHLKINEKSNLDVLVIYNYQSLILPSELIEEINSYTSIHLVAWSLGVWVANHICSHYKIKLSNSIAYNGSLFPVHNELGIPLRIAQATLKTLNEKNWELFLKQMTLGLSLKQTNKFYKKGQIEMHKQSLNFLYQCFKAPFKKNLFKQAIIGNNDVIIPTIAQQKAWGELDIPYQSIDTPHYPFASYNNWQELLKTSF